MFSQKVRYGKELSRAHTCKPMYSLEQAQAQAREISAEYMLGSSVMPPESMLDKIVKDTWEAGQRDLIDQGFTLNENAFYE